MPIISFEEYSTRIDNLYGKSVYKIDRSTFKGRSSQINARCVQHDILFNVHGGDFVRGANIGCKTCKKLKRHLKNSKKQTKRFLQRCQKIHHGKYDYSKICYQTNFIPVEIICPIHGSFYQRPANHLYGCGCPECKKSNGEEIIAQILHTSKIQFVYQYKVEIKGSNHYFDFYLPEKNLIIEYNGRQHYDPVDYFGGQKILQYTQTRDKIKKGFCKNLGIPLVIIKYTDNIENMLKKICLI